MIAALLMSTVMQWNLQIEPAGTLHLMTIYRSPSAKGGNDDEMTGRSYPQTSLATIFKGLSVQQLRTPGTPLRFQVVRQEGTLTFTGRSGRNAASGDFTYALDQGFAANLQRRGAGRPTEGMQLQWLMADADVYALLDAAAESGLSTPNVSTINQAINHGVTARFIVALQACGFQGLTLEQAVTLVDHGVTPHYLDGLTKLGYHVTPDQAVRLIDHGVTIAYIERLRSSGYSNLTVEDLIRLVDHGVH